MKLILTHRHHSPSPSFTALIEQHLETFHDALQIDEARVLVERRLEASPPFRMTAHLVTPGPDVFAEAVDHTLHAALQKMIAEIRTRVDHRQQKRTQSERSHFKTASPAHLTPPVGRL